jgi:hypothetical protein
MNGWRCLPPVMLGLALALALAMVVAVDVRRMLQDEVRHPSSEQ